MQSKVSNQMCLDVYKDHWQKALSFINIRGDFTSSETVFKHLDIMISIIIKECDEGSSSLSDILEFSQENSIFQTLLVHFKQDNLAGEVREMGIVNQLRMYDNLVNFLPTEYLTHKNMISALIGLLEECSIRSSLRIEQLSVRMLYQITILVTRSKPFLDFIKQISQSDYHEPYYFVGLLIQMMHRDRDIGRLSQEALLLLFNFCRENDDELVEYLCGRSDFSAILTTVLSGLYSSFPRKFEGLPVDDWQQISRSFINTVPELKHSLQLLDFCNLVLKMGHCRIQHDILDFIYSGFLSPVIGPSLHQNSLEETISATAYLELFLRRLHQPLLIKLFLHFILTERQENYVVLDSLINRLSSITMDSVEGMYRLGIVTLSLFRTILSFHCEDVMFHLIFKYLIPCDHLVKQQWQHIANDEEENQNEYQINNQSISSNCSNIIDQHTFDTIRHQFSLIGHTSDVNNYQSKINYRLNEDFSSSTEQYLNISLGIYSEDSNNISCNKSDMKILLDQRRASQSTVVINNLEKYRLASPFHSYLQTAAILVNRRILATECWQYSYDGLSSPSVELIRSMDEDNIWMLQYQPQHKRSSETVVIDDDVVNDDDNMGDELGARHQVMATNGYNRDVGYYSNNGSNSTVLSRAVISNVPPPLPSYNMDDMADANAGRFSIKINSKRHNKNGLVSRLCQSTQSIYKLHFPVLHDDDSDADEDQEPMDMSVSQNVDALDCPSSIETQESFVILPSDDVDDHEEIEEDTNFTNVLLSATPESEIAEFVTSIHLLQYTNGYDRIQSRNWSVDWEGDFLLLLMEHGVNIGNDGDEEDNSMYNPLHHANDNGDDDEEDDYCENHDNQNVPINQLPHVNFTNNVNNRIAPQLPPDTNTQSTPTNEAIFKRRLQSFDNSLYTSPAHANFSVTLGPFLTALFQRLSVMTSNNYFMNLLLTGIFTDLASYPNPLIKNLLLDVDIILQPHLSKLFEILSNVRTQLLEYSTKIVGWETILDSAYEYLYYRINPTVYEQYLSQSMSNNGASNRSSIKRLSTIEDEYELRFVIGASINSSEDDYFRRNFNNIMPTSFLNNDKKSRRTPFGILNKKRKPVLPQYKFPVAKHCYSNKKSVTEYEAQHIRNLAYNWILFDEFCKELASLCQEHTQHCFF